MTYEFFIHNFNGTPLQLLRTMFYIFFYYIHIGIDSFNTNR